MYNVTLNGKKCHIFCKTVEYLEFTLSAAGVQPQEKKIRAITQIAAPRNKKQLRRFLGMLNYYREMVAGKSALLKPLTRITSPKAAFVWTSIENEAFEGVKKALASAVLLSFPDFTKPFEIYADASGKQLGGLIQQDRKLIALTPAQQNYTTTDLELLSVVEILKEYRTMLLGFPIIVHTDHKNLIYPTETSLRIKRWKLLLAEYRLTCQYIQGKANIGADAFSRMELERELKNLDVEDETLYIEPVDCVVEGRHIKQHQQADEVTETLVQACMNGTSDPDYRIENTMGAKLLTFKKRVMIPEALREEITEWYHLNLVHPSAKRQYHTMRTSFYWSGMEKSIVTFSKNCLTCKRSKLHGGPQRYGKLPPRDLEIVDPFDIVHVDTMGPYGNERSYALTVIDEATRWLEVSIQSDNHGRTTAENFDTTWLCRYRRPKEVIFDRGNEFNTSEFREILKSYAIKAVPISVKNPQANAICERVHLVLNNCIRCYPETDWRQCVQATTRYLEPHQRI
ncbi:Pol protein [Phytophthora palmivora]|uniref:Pol protein n=1 Tax=Phytophthora palmivora TaxID=4796 RepID=A0A2P4X615_9STRA|nr:Pol protein [Phytophthora palmivora]